MLVVSHNIRQVERLCTRTILMDHGKISTDGKPKDVCNTFYDISDKRIREMKNRSSLPKGRRESSGDIELETVTMLDTNGNPIKSIEYLQDVEFQVKYLVKRQLPQPNTR